MPTIISIEGNTGSGKTTLINCIESHRKRIVSDNIHFVKEQVDIWENIKDNNNINILEYYYMNKERWGFSFQLLALITKLESIKELVQKYGQDIIIICERSFQADREIFVKMLYEDKFINDIEIQIYDKYLADIIKEFKIDGSVYLKTDPIVCYSRINKRKRKGEDIINSRYLTKCEKYYEDYFNSTELTTLLIENNNEDNIENIIVSGEIIDYINKIIEDKRNQMRSRQYNKVNINKIMNCAWC
jgi:deoxyadenosine/deoxycytidine kinase